LECEQTTVLISPLQFDVAVDLP